MLDITSLGRIGVFTRELAFSLVAMLISNPSAVNNKGDPDDRYYVHSCDIRQVKLLVGTLR